MCYYLQKNRAGRHPGEKKVEKLHIVSRNRGLTTKKLITILGTNLMKKENNFQISSIYFFLKLSVQMLC